MPLLNAFGTIFVSDVSRTIFVSDVSLFNDSGSTTVSSDLK